MKARDVMVSPVITVRADLGVADAATLFLERNISGAPVTDDAGAVIGIITEGDLILRSEIGTERQHPGWFTRMAPEDLLAAEYVRSRARHVKDLMQSKVITAAPHTPLNEICSLMERNSIRRVPILQDRELVGIITRTNILQALASVPNVSEPLLSDSEIRRNLLRHLGEQKWAHLSRLNIIVHDGGVVDLWGFATLEIEKQALRVAAENAAGVRIVNDHIHLQQALVSLEPQTDRELMSR